LTKLYGPGLSGLWLRCSQGNAQQKAELVIKLLVFAVHEHLSNCGRNAHHREDQDPEESVTLPVLAASPMAVQMEKVQPSHGMKVHVVSEYVSDIKRLESLEWTMDI